MYADGLKKINKWNWCTVILLKPESAFGGVPTSGWLWDQSVRRMASTANKQSNTHTHTKKCEIQASTTTP